MKKLFVFDIDGTLMPEGGNLTEGSINAIKLINSNNDIPVLATGRALSQTKSIAKDLGVKKYLITTAGLMITDIENNKDIEMSFVPLKILNYFLDLAEKVKRQLNIKLTDKAVKYYFGKNPEEEIDSESLFWKKGGTLNPTYNKLSNFYHDVDTNKILQVSIKAEPELVNSLKEQVNKEIKEFGDEWSVSIVSSVYLELSNSKHNKATAIHKIMELESIDENNVYVFGDSENDIEMISSFKNSFAMGNAIDNLKKIANTTLDSCENDGVYKYISEFYKM